MRAMLVGQAKESGAVFSQRGGSSAGRALTCLYPKRIPSDMVMSLPLAAYKGKTVLVDSDEAAELAVAEIEKETLLGFDTESRPSFKKGQDFPVSILQLGGENCVWVFKLGALAKSYPKIFSILENANIKKVGVAVRGDLNALGKLHNFTPAGFEDISESTKKIGIINTGLKNLSGLFLGKRISKSAQMSNWAAETLSEKQIVYAATDAWISRALYEEVSKVMSQKRYALEPESAPEPKPRGVFSWLCEKIGLVFKF